MAERLFYRWAELVLRARWPVLMGLIGVLIGTLVLIQNMGLALDNRPEVFAPKNDASHLALEKLREAFGRDDFFIVTIEGDVFTPPFLNKMKKLHQDLEKLVVKDLSSDKKAPPSEHSTIKKVFSLINAQTLKKVEEGTSFTALMNAENLPKDLSEIKKDAFADPQVNGRLISEDGKHTVLFLQTALISEKDSGRVDEALQSLLVQHRSDNFHPMVAGVPTISARPIRATNASARPRTGSRYESSTNATSSARPA